MSSARAKTARGVAWHLLILRALHVAVLIAAVSALGGAYYARGQAQVDPRKPQTQLTNVLLGVGVLSLLLAWLVPGQVALNLRMRVGRQVTQAQPDEDDETPAATRPEPAALAGGDLFWAGRYWTCYAARLGLLAVGAFAMALAHLLEGPSDPVVGADKLLPLVGGGVFVVAIAWQFPTRLRLLYWAHTQRTLVLRDRAPADEGQSFF
jgi:hypothetical protein